MPLACPACRAPLDPSSTTPCSGCGRSWPRHHGLLDLRLDPRDDPGDREIIAELEAHASTETYADLVRRVFRHRRQQRAAADRGGDRAFERFRDRVEAAYLETFARRGAMHRRLLEGMVGEAGRRVRVGELVDVGCGWGRDLLHLAGLAGRAHGVDISPLSLLLSSKLLDEHGITNVQLVLAAAEALPFADGSVDAINSSACIEHLRRPADLLAETSRCLAGGGWVFLYYPNRHSLLPEGHTGIPGLGWLPRPLQDAVVRRRFGRAWEVTLMSRRGFSRLASREIPDADQHISGIPGGLAGFADSSALGAGRGRWWAAPVLRLVPRHGPLAQLVTGIAPVHFVVLARR